MSKTVSKTKNTPLQRRHPRYNTHVIHHDYFSAENMARYPERFVLVGFIAADGCITTKGKYTALVFNLSQKDACIVDAINEELADGLRHVSVLKGTRSLMMNFPSKNMCADLARYGIVPRKTDNFRLPELNDQQLRYFLRGYFYGDGNVTDYHNRRCYHFYVTTVFGEALRQRLTGIVDHCVVSISKKKPKFCQLVFQGRNAASFERYIFDDDRMTLLPRKHPKILAETLYGYG